MFALSSKKASSYVQILQTLQTSGFMEILIGVG